MNNSGHLLRKDIKQFDLSWNARAIFSMSKKSQSKKQDRGRENLSVFILLRSESEVILLIFHETLVNHFLKLYVHFFESVNHTHSQKYYLSWSQFIVLIDRENAIFCASLTSQKSMTYPGTLYSWCKSCVMFTRIPRPVTTVCKSLPPWPLLKMYFPLQLINPLISNIIYW